MIIVITDRSICVSDLLDHMVLIAEASPDMIILREKDLSEKEYRRLAADCERICLRHNVKFCVNSFIDVAVSAGGTCVQLPFETFMERGTETAGIDEVWVSVHSLSEAVRAEGAGATHLIYGNVYETSCKPGAEAKGLKELKEICDTVKIPVFAVGGIDAGTVKEVIAAGCRGICIRSLVMTSSDPGAEIKRLREGIRAVSPGSP